MRAIRFINVLTMMIFLGIFCISCTTTQQTLSVERSGFLDNYKQLNKSKKDQTKSVYIDKSTNFSLYDKLIIKPVRLIASEESDLAKASKKNIQAIADYFYALLSQQLSQNYTIVEKPGPKTMELRVALTDMTGAKVVIDTSSSMVPIDMATNVIAKVTTGNNLSVGSATGEMELVDSTTGRRLVAGVDTGKFDKWRKRKDTKGACDYWAERMTAGLYKLVDADYLLYGNQKPDL